ncbi:hypothetical protein [Streptomyces sp. NBC_01244]|uniref:hypothetical protein n=1 Tax=Streptomyces sp. NBC_01244 TaxID=2903797 RepID=UPI002E12035B
MAPIRSTAAPTIKGTAAVGGKVTATTGSWSPAADSHTYQWQPDGKTIAGATAASYTLPSTLQGKQLTVVVTARKAGHPTVKATSTGVLVKGAAPKATKAPSITGTAKVGSVLTLSRGTWTRPRTTTSGTRTGRPSPAPPEPPSPRPARSAASGSPRR